MPPVIGFLLGFLLFILVAAVVILGLRYLIRISGVTGELAQIAYIVVFIVLIVAFFYSAPWHWTWTNFGR